MKRYIQLLIPTLFLATAVIPAAAVPAKPGVMKIKQADGKELPVRLVGDERSHYYLSEDGYLLVNDNEKFYYGNVDADGQLIRSDIRATVEQERTAEAREYLNQVDMPQVFQRLSMRAEKAAEARARKAPQRGPGLFAETNFPAHGEQKGLVILVEYKDVKMTLSNPLDYFTRMLNEPGFNDYGGTGSAVDFFHESSNGIFQPEFDVYGPITLSNNRSYYGGNNWYGDDQNPEMMIIEACQQLDDQIDFTQYDRDDDGYIDNVFVFYAGQGEASGGPSSSVWPHSWNISAATSTPYYFDGVRLDRYACSNEWETGRPDGVGTFVHEFSHVLGLPDLYATSYTSAFTPGAWSAMDYGPYNNDGCTPPLYSAFERYALDWVEPLEINGPVNATLYPIGTNQCGIIRTSKANEYFLVENRQQTSWDTYIPGHGMLIWHVDYNASVWASNSVNNSASHQYVDIEEADGTQNEYSREGDAFPGTSHKTSFTKSTNPAMKTWGGVGLDYPITEIAENNGVITFKVCGGREPLTPTVAFDAEDISSDGFTAKWQSAGEDASYVLNVYTINEVLPTGASEIEYLEGYQNLNVGKVTSYPVVGTQADTEYFYTISVGDGWEVSEPSNAVSVITGRLPIDRLAVVAHEASDITAYSFVAHWEPLESADSYTLNVYTKEFGAPIIDVCDFTDGTENLPEGWNSTSGASYANSAYSGEAVPALRLSTSKDVLTTPVYEEGIRTFAMWHRGNSTADEDMVKIEALTNGEWTTLAEIPVVKEKGGATTEITDIPAGTTQMRVSYVRTGTKGALAIDDIKVGYSSTYTNIPVEGYVDLGVGNVVDYVVDGINPNTQYFYTVKAVDADGLQSKASQEIALTTADDSGNVGLNDATVAQGQIKADGLSLTLTGASAGSVLNVYDTLGRLVATSVANIAGYAQVQLPAAGIYVAVVPQDGLRVKVTTK